MTAAISNFSLGNLSYIGVDYDDQVPESAVATPKRSQGLLARFQEWRRRRQVMAELALMTDRELSDIGLTRSDLARVFDPAFGADRARGDYIAF